MDFRSSYSFDECKRNEGQKALEAVLDGLKKGSAPGMEWTGWIDYPDEKMAKDIREVKDYVKTIEARDLYVLGIGGSYLGAYAAICALEKEGVHFYGNSFSARDLERGLAAYDPKKDHVVVISKSGSTRETAMAFRFFLEKAEAAGADLSKSVTAITDGKKGKLHDFAEAKKIRRFVVPEDMGGRYSVLSPVGLFPMAFAGVDLEALMKGARDAKGAVARDPKAIGP